jgi:ArsR family transcriptional regulator, arsenate/arsenite/antimonite-responsive transcriptional repressor / arsenate reductase (thioredoxin)
VPGVEAGDDRAPDEFLRLIADARRWRLLRELAMSDLRVNELVDRLDSPQNLVSYHLRELRAGGLVSARQSSADRRDTYYRLEAAEYARRLAEVGGALHPGLRISIPAPSVDAGLRPPRVLFLCTGNSARSQIAEALLRHRSGGVVDARSAGSHPKALHANAVRVMAERGIDISAATTRHLRRFARVHFDRVITLCDRVREICPEFPGRPLAVHWSIPDPALEGETDDASYPAFVRTADELDARIGVLLAQLSPPEEDPHGRPDRQRALSRG